MTEQEHEPEAVAVAGARFVRATPTDAWRDIRDTYPSISPVGFRELTRAYPTETTYPSDYVLVAGRDVWAVWDTTSDQRRGRLQAMYTLLDEVRHDR